MAQVSTLAGNDRVLMVIGHYFWSVSVMFIKTFRERKGSLGNLLDEKTISTDFLNQVANGLRELLGYFRGYRGNNG